MLITAHVRNAPSVHEITVASAGSRTTLSVRAKQGGQGSAVNGGEFLMLALATCFCNDVYREAARLKIEVTSVEVEALAEFEGIGLAATGIRYRARIGSSASEADIERLLRETDAVAEVHNTLRAGAGVSRVPWDTPDARSPALNAQ